MSPSQPKPISSPPPTLSTLGPDDPEALALLGTDLLPRSRPYSRVSISEGGITSLEPILTNEGEREKIIRKKMGNSNQRNLTEGHAGHIRADPLEVSLPPSSKRSPVDQ